nr:unnamed protein product [Callosobruchus analis]
MAIFPDIVRTLTTSDHYTDLPEFGKRFAKVLEYNVPDNENFLGLPTVVCYKALEGPENLTPANIVLANIIGWCAEMLVQAGGIGLTAIYDALLVETGIRTVLRKYLGNRKCYRYIEELFHDIALQTIIGQTMDMKFKTSDGMPRLDLFTMKQYRTLIKYKICCYFCLPMSLAMYLANIYDPEQHRQAKRICLEIGEFFQRQNDFLDCFGIPEKTGKESSDIQESKCTWLAVVALQKANSAQRKIMQEHYGKADERDVQMIKNLYLELGLPATYRAAEEELLSKIQTDIQQAYSGKTMEVLLRLLNQHYNFEAPRIRSNMLKNGQPCKKTQLPYINPHLFLLQAPSFWTALILKELANGKRSNKLYVFENMTSSPKS